LRGSRTGLDRWPSLIVLCLLAACEGKPGNVAPATVPAEAPARPGYESELRKLGAAIDHGLELGARRPEDNLLALEVVALYQERARLSGDYDDYRRAEKLLASRTGAQALPSHCLALARLHYTLHRLKQAGAALDSCPASAEAAEVAALRADIALHSGRYRETEGVYRALVNRAGTAQQYVRLALLRNKTGSPAEAAALLEAAEKRYHGNSPTMKAWLKLQRGLVALDRGRPDEALAMYRLAGDALPGWWLVDEHIAEVLQLSGKTSEAKALYESVVARTRAPEFMDALASIELEQGNEARARQLLAEVRMLYERRLAAFPEAAAGHALDHYLRDPADAPVALSLARKNFSDRPYGDSAIALAKASMLSGEAQRAAALIEAQLASGWDTAEAYWILGEALGKLGQRQRSSEAKAEALRRNPLSDRMYAFAK
jgi:predicted Zn-dependent protease